MSLATLEERRSSSGMTPEIWIAGLLGIAATAEDLLRRQVSNWIPVAALCGGIGCHVGERGWMGIPIALAGAACGFAVFLVFYWLGGMGGGDVKLMAGFGAVLGADRLVEAAFFTAAIGGILAASVIGFQALRRMRRTDGPRAADPRWIPYAPAITAGAWLALIPK
ncbi:MAG: A24 family peptidase [Bryobacteraceae bacterium]